MSPVEQAADIEHPPAFVPPRALTTEHREIWVAIIALFKILEKVDVMPRREILATLRDVRSHIRTATDIDEAFTRMFGKGANEDV